MFATLRNRVLKWGRGNHLEKHQSNRSFILRASIKILEDIIFWRKTYLSFVFALFLSVLYFICVQHDVQLIELFTVVYFILISLDAFEMWLRHKHRTNFLQNLVPSDGEKLYQGFYLLEKWMKQKWNDYILLRETNHTKAFLCMNITFGMVFVIGKAISGYTLVYIVLMLITWFRILAPPIIKLFKKFQQTAICDEGDIDSLIPEVSEQDLKELSFEVEYAVDGKQSLDYWKPEEPLGDISDSSENSSSMVTNLSVEDTHTLEQNIDSSSSSSEDEYLPKAHIEDQIQTTLDVIHPGGTWSSSALNAFWNLTGAVANLVSSPAPVTQRRKRMSSVDSSDGFEIVDKSDVM